MLKHLAKICEKITRVVEISIYDKEVGIKAKIKARVKKSRSIRHEGIIGEEEINALGSTGLGSQEFESEASKSKIIGADIVYHPTFIGKVVGKKYVSLATDIKGVSENYYYLHIKGIYLHNYEIREVDGYFPTSESLHCQFYIGDHLPKNIV